jgi:AraC-like DNA-binding protein
MSQILSEITPLSKSDCFYIIARDKPMFDYPIHSHAEYELNFVCHCNNSRRIVGDSIEVLGEYDLALIGGEIPHCWEQHMCRSESIHEVTIQFSPTLLSEELLQKNAMRPIREMLERAKTGIAFEMATIMSVYGKLEELIRAQAGFMRLLKFLEILHMLAESTAWHKLSSSAFSNIRIPSESRRITKIQEEISNNYNKPLLLNDLASKVGMTPTAFSRFFKMRTGRTLSDYILDVRIGHASRMLVDTTMNMSEICYECGFNNISNFNRIFKKRKGCCPKEFRENFLKTKLII